MATRWVLAQPESAAAIRHDISGELLAAGVTPDVVDDVILVASELISNAVRHANSLPSGICRSAGNGTPAGSRSASPTAVARSARVRAAPVRRTRRGRGLAIVSALADFWGVRRGTDTVTVWAHLPGRTAGAAAQLTSA